MNTCLWGRDSLLLIDAQFLYARDLLDQIRAFFHQKAFERDRDRRQTFVLAMHDVPVEHHRKALDVQHDQMTELQFEADGMRGEKRNAHAGNHPVFAGALIFAASAISVCKMRGLFDVLNASAAARPGHRVVNLTALALCGWLGYMFVTGPAPIVGLEALLATGALAGALGVHLMLDGALASHAAHAPTFAFAGRCHGFFVRERIEWRAGEEPAWALREMPTRVIRTAAHRRERDWPSGTRGNERRRAGARHRCAYHSVRRQL